MSQRSPIDYKTRLGMLTKMPLVLRFILLHLSFFLVFTTEFNTWAIIAFSGSYLLRIIGVTLGYHRYFSHRSFETNRVFAFVLGTLGAAAGQRGPLWWAAQHRRHHRYSDREGDHHSPKLLGFWQSHMGWVFAKSSMQTNFSEVPDWMDKPELMWINKWHTWILMSYGILMFATGELLANYFQTSGWQFLVWGFVVSTLATAHVTLSVNSIAHSFGSKRFKTSDESRNVWWLSIPTLGDGWHNNHHRFPSSARHGMVWYEIDINYYFLCFLEKIGIVSNIKKPLKEA